MALSIAIHLSPFGTVQESLAKDLNKKIPIKGRDFLLLCDLAGARTQDHLLKREVLYQLSYQVKMF